ncbi:hypothetical protein ACYCVF_33310 [Bradyrhizobium sp. 1.29L]
MHKTLLLDVAAMLTVTRFAAAAEIEVRTLNKNSNGGIIVFEPTLAKLEPGETPSNSLPPTGDTMPRASKVAARRRGSLRRQKWRRHEREIRSGRRLWREVAAALRHSHVAAIVVGSQTNSKPAKAVPQVGKARADVCNAVRENGSRQAPTPSRGSLVCRSRVFTTTRVPRRPTASAFFLLRLIYAGVVIPLWLAYLLETLRRNAVRVPRSDARRVSAYGRSDVDRPPSAAGHAASAGLHPARWSDRGVLIAVNRMRGLLIDRHGIFLLRCDEDCRSRIGADVDDEIGQELMRRRMSAPSAAEGRSPSRTTVAS